jgi:hypothetical protein
LNVALAGYSGTVLLQVGAVLAAFVVVMYILRLRRRPVAVAFAPLWQQVLRDKDATSLLARLKRWLSLLIQLAILCALLFALGDPRPEVRSSDARHIVVLVDASASMKATDVPKETPRDSPTAAATRLDHAKQKLRDWVRGLAGDDRMLIVQIDAAVTPVTTMTNDKAQLEAAIAGMAASDVRANFDRAFGLAFDALNGRTGAEIVVLSDGVIGPLEIDSARLATIKLSYAKVGTTGRNVAVTSLAVRRYPLDKSRYEVLVEISNTHDRDEQIELELYGDGQLSDIVKLELAAGESLRRIYPNLAGSARMLEARVRLRGGEADDLPADDRAYALLPERRRARVQVVTRGNMYLDAALLLDEYLDVTTMTPDEYPAKGQFDVTIFDSVAPGVTPGSGHVLYLNPPADGRMPFTAKKRIKSDKRYTIGFDELETKHPVLRHLMLADVNVAKARVLKGGDNSRAIGKSFRGTLLLVGRDQGHKYVALGFDIRDSDLPLRIAWPLFVVNVIDDFLDEDANYLSSLRTGQVWKLAVPSDGVHATLELPSGAETLVPVNHGRAVFLGQAAGVYGLSMGPGEAVTRFAANMASRSESTIAPAAELAVGGVKAGPVTGFGGGAKQQWWFLALLAVMAVLALEWLSYHRRVTV